MTCGYNSVDMTIPSTEISELHIEMVSKLKQLIQDKVTVNIKTHSMGGMVDFGTGIITQIKSVQANLIPDAGNHAVINIPFTIITMIGDPNQTNQTITDMLKNISSDTNHESEITFAIDIDYIYITTI